MTNTKDLREEVEAFADSALEKEVLENQNGFLERPYNRYRFHSGYIAGATSPDSPLLKEALKFIESLVGNTDLWTDEHGIRQRTESTTSIRASALAKEIRECMEAMK